MNFIGVLSFYESDSQIAQFVNHPHGKPAHSDFNCKLAKLIHKNTLLSKF